MRKLSGLCIVAVAMLYFLVGGPISTETYHRVAITFITIGTLTCALGLAFWYRIKKDDS